MAHLKLIIFPVLYFGLAASLSAQAFDVENLILLNSMSLKEVENKLLAEYNVEKNGEVLDVPAKGIRNSQFQKGSINLSEFMNLEKISLGEENLLISLFIKDEGKTYRKVKQEFFDLEFLPVERENFLEPFQKLMKAEFFLRKNTLFQVDTYKDAEGKEYHLILATTLSKYRKYQELYEGWKKYKPLKI